VLDGLLNLFYPEECFVCAEAVSRHRDCGVCPHCWERALALRIRPPRCACCGLPFQSFDYGPDHLCGGCMLELPPYAGARSFGYYTGELGRVIQELKFRGRRGLAGRLAPLLAAAYAETWADGDFDLLAAVPLHPGRKRERGYNQSELLARALARLLDIPCRPLLDRVRETLPQVGLPDSKRKENVRGAFRCAHGCEPAGKRILLIDDVMTTGATVASAAGALLAGGALRVSVLTVARAGKG